MKKILTATTNETVIKTVKTACKKYAAYFDSDIFSDTEQVITFVDFEMPEIKVLDFSSPDVDAYRILAAINQDPWLHYGGIIAVCKNQQQVQEIEAKKDVKILIAQTVREFSKHFSRLLRILWQNQQFLFNRGMQDVIGGMESGSFVCINDPMDIRFYSNFLVSYLYNTNRINDDERFNLQMALGELLTNALEHGNLEIDYDMKTDWMSRGGDIIDLIAKRSALPEFKNRLIHISYDIGRVKSLFKIRDDGNGFDWKSIILNSAGHELHGRGVNLSRELVQNLSYNDLGNEVSFEITNIVNKTNTVPGIMKPFETLVCHDKEVICRENEESNDLFFIVSGRFAVYSGRKLVSVLTPNDMFIGEMAFLLNDRRSATVLAVGVCKLIRIPKGAFLALIRKNPHYGIFLSKMLALRLQKQTQQTVKLFG